MIGKSCAKLERPLIFSWNYPPSPSKPHASQFWIFPGENNMSFGKGCIIEIYKLVLLIIQQNISRLLRLGHFFFLKSYSEQQLRLFNFSWPLTTCSELKKKKKKTLFWQFSHQMNYIQNQFLWHYCKVAVSGAKKRRKV